MDVVSVSLKESSKIIEEGADDDNEDTISRLNVSGDDACFDGTDENSDVPVAGLDGNRDCGLSPHQAKEETFDGHSPCPHVVACAHIMQQELLLLKKNLYLNVSAMASGMVYQFEIQMEKIRKQAENQSGVLKALENENGALLKEVEQLKQYCSD